MGVSSAAALRAPGSGPAPGADASTDRVASPRLALVPVLLLVTVSLVGSPYYLLPIAERVRHPWHEWLRPSGLVGQSAGILALLLFLFLWLYPLRKRVPALAFTGSMAKWLNVHIAAGVLVPLAGAVHAAWRVHGLVGMGYLAMCVVALSGVVGRYLYVRIPRRKDGLELSRDEVVTRRREMITRLSALTSIPPAGIEAMLAPSSTASTGVLGTLMTMLRDDLARRRAERRFLARLQEAGGDSLDRESLAEVLTLARREMALAQQVRVLDQTYRIFRFWHAAHMPVAISALLAVLVHVVVVVGVGATWFW